MAGWLNFFVAQVGASAALTGLVFVAISINLTKIVAGRDLSGWALAAIILLVSVLVESSVFLVPGLSSGRCGLLVLLIGLLAWLILCLVQRAVLGRFDAKYRAEYLRLAAFTQVSVLAAFSAAPVSWRAAATPGRSTVPRCRSPRRG